MERKPKVFVPAIIKTQTAITVEEKIAVLIEQSNAPSTIYVMYEADPYEDEGMCIYFRYSLHPDLSLEPGPRAQCLSVFTTV